MSIKNTLDKYINKIEASIPSVFKIFFGAAIIYSLGVGYLAYKTNKEKQITDATVMITRLNGGGGSGVVIENSPTESVILTNNHVCQAVERGGYVTTTTGKKALVFAYAPAFTHDLCLIWVNTDLDVSSSLAAKSPKLYTEATISGHPNLLPNVVSKGHFSGTKVIQVLTGFKPCTDEMKESSPDMAGICQFFGGFPIVKMYEAQLVTAMIMAGSSGSAVYNSKGEISGLVFAGSDGLSYAYTVPYEYVKGFVDQYKTNPESLNVVKIDYTINPFAESSANSESQMNYNEYIKEKCKSATHDKIKEYCGLIQRDL